MFDTLIIGGRCPNFVRGTLERAEIALKDGVIAAILPAGARPEASVTLDAAGKVVSPGFIDMHMHEEAFASGDHRYTIANYMIRQGVTTAVAGNCGEEPHPIAQFRSILEANGGCPANYIMLAGYNTIRQQLGVGWYEDTSPAQRQEIQSLIRRELEEGAWGFSFGLEYAPGISTAEMTEAVLALREYDPFISIHFRADCDECMASIEEMAQLSRDTGCRVQLSHLSSLAGTAHNMPAALDFLSKEIAANPLFGYDTYPYAAFSTGIGTAVFDMNWREKWGVDYDSVLLLHPPYTGQRCDKALYEKVRRETPEARVVVFAMEEESIRDAVACPAGLLGSDGILDASGQGHPRAAGTFPRILGRYVREAKALTLMEALDKMTRRAARRIGLIRKGEIQVGFDADLTIFDPDTILDGADFTDLDRPNTGIDYVLVKGQVVADHDALTGALPGRLLTREGK